MVQTICFFDFASMILHFFHSVNAGSAVLPCSGLGTALLLYAGMTFHSTRTRLTEAREELKARLAAQQVLRLENEALSRQIAVVEAEDIGE